MALLRDLDGIRTEWSGRLDWLRELPNGGIEIVDWKSGNRLPSEDALAADPVTTMYARMGRDLARRQMGWTGTEVRFSQLYLGATEKVTVTVTRERVDAAEAELARLARVLVEGGSLPATEGAWCHMNVRLIRRNDGESLRTRNAQWLVEEMAGGGRAAWICNTVAEAQAVYRVIAALSAAPPVAERPKVMLFHARFLARDRRRIEKHVLRRFGPSEAPRPARERSVILVATQVVEQSLDLDFDVMVSQLAPVDLLLQRLGRLWRHPERTQRGGFNEPRIVLLEPERGVAGRPVLGANGLVYSPLIMLRTLAALGNKEFINLPAEIRGLIEAVYALNTPPTPSALQEAKLQ